MVAAGNNYSLLLTGDRSLYGFGYSSYGQLGTDTYRINNPTEIVPSGVIGMATGYNHSLFIRNDGSLWAMGSDEYGQLGNGSMSNQSSPVSVSGISNATQVSAGSNHTCARLQ